ncbi:MarR family transcriptional regulator [Ahrensia kielensis]|uniref:MarR family transcriptional regulator n=1 Tax=Ahrensia kielensis TaxID=76980 RepID=A0ABU9TB54_9HYPH
MPLQEDVTTYKAQNNLGYCLSRAALIMQTAVDAALIEIGLNRLSWTVLACIRFEGIESPSKIAEFVGLERTTASRLITRLEKQGFVTRQPSNEDGRGHSVKPTLQGIEACKKGPALIEAATRPYLSDLSENNVKQLIYLLKHIGTGTVANWKVPISK